MSICLLRNLNNFNNKFQLGYFNAVIQRSYGQSVTGYEALTAEGQRLVSEGSYLLKGPLSTESRNVKFQIPIFTGEWVGSQLLMLSSEMLKSKIPIFAGGVGGVGVSSQLSEVNFKISKSSPELKFPFLQVGVGEGGTWSAWNVVLPPSMHLG